MTIRDFLNQYPEACPEAQRWLRSLGDTTMQEAWRRCHQVDWMLWALHRIKHKSFPGPRHFVCDCADRALKRERRVGRDPDPRSWAAVKAARAYLEGRGTRKRMRKAGEVAWAASWPVTRVRAAAWAAEAAAWAAENTVWAAEAAEAVRDAAWVARDAERTWQADRLRHYVAEWPK